jgi:uncharacterized 2Fe-2S/4Fe-4S cluster protein (DUF4445 family)
LLLGVDPSPMGSAPFTPAFTRSREVRAADIGLPFGEARLFTLPCVSAWIGADAVAGAYVCGLKTRKGGALFIDIGTNGEIVLARGGEGAENTLLSCSCAMGPALEGMNIRCGMRAAAGAIEDVRIEGAGAAGALRVRLGVIGDVPPTGVCGSGVLSAIRELLRVGLLTPDGTLLGEGDLAPGDPRLAPCRAIDGQNAVRLCAGVVLTQKDIREVQLAKGALLSGVRALLDKAGAKMDDIGKVLVAGQFGARLPAASLTGCGLLPDISEDEIEYVGNTSRMGAQAALSPSARRAMEELAGSIGYVELSAMEGYEKLFLGCLGFPEPASICKS